MPWPTTGRAPKHEYALAVRGRQGTQGRTSKKGPGTLALPSHLGHLACISLMPSCSKTATATALDRSEPMRPPLATARTTGLGMAAEAAAVAVGA